MSDSSPSRLYLASASPRRFELLSRAGVRFRVFVPSFNEPNPPRFLGNRRASALVKQIALQKGLAAATQLQRRGIRTGYVLSADTLVFHGSRVLGKPRSVREAAGMLRLLSGNWHTVHTGVSLIRIHKERCPAFSFSVGTRVKFFPLSEDEISRYIKTGEPMDKSGSYGCQGLGAALVRRYSGSYTNVVGLPVGETLRFLVAKTGLPLSAWQKSE